MKKLIFFTLLVSAALLSTGVAADRKSCDTIQKGNLFDKYGEQIVVGYNDWGYNYQARLFNGQYCDAYQDAGWCQDYAEDRLSMKWNDAWLSNRDCDGDGALDRHHGHDSYIGSGAWLTNHIAGEYLSEDGELCHWNEFYKIVAAPADAHKKDGFWFTAEGDLIGPDIWGQFITVLQIGNDSCGEDNGVVFGSPVGPGLGRY